MARVISEELLCYVPPIISINISSMDKRRRNLWRYNKNLGAYEIKKRYVTVNLIYPLCLDQLTRRPFYNLQNVFQLIDTQGSPVPLWHMNG